MKSEIRRPKTENRNTRAAWSVGSAHDAEIGSTPSGPYPRIPRFQNSGFGLRISFGFRPSAFGLRLPGARAFTLIELLIVIAIMGILAALIIPIAGVASRNRIRAKARTELEQVATGIDLYKAKLGTYPPDNPRNPGLNQLYFELLGTTATNLNGKPAFVTLDGTGRAYSSSLLTLFNAAGIINSSTGTGGDEGRKAKAFLTALKPGQYMNITNPPVDINNEIVRILTSSVPPPPIGANNICYVSSNPTNNPNSYDLWVDIVINGVTNRISNWNQQPITLP